MVQRSIMERNFLPTLLNRRKVSKFILFNLAALVLVTIFFSGHKFEIKRHRTTLPSSTRHITTKEGATQKPPTKNPRALYSIPEVPESSSSDCVPLLQPNIMDKYLKYEQREYHDTVVILTPIHNSARHLAKFANILESITYPHKLISIAFGEDCSEDETLSSAKDVAKDLRESFKRVDVFHFNITGAVGGLWSSIHMKQNQLQRRGHLALSRNMLTKAGLRNAKWALWVDSDITYLPPDIIQQLMSSGKDIVVPACLYNQEGYLRVFDKNTWRETPQSLAYQRTLPDDELILEGYGVSRRIFLTDLRADGRVVPIDGVGGCTLLIKGDNHRKGLKFPETIFDHHIETEGLAKMAKKMGIGVFGMPFVEVLH